ncbi:MAG: transcriptional regulator SpxA [Caldibacillus sp.]
MVTLYSIPSCLSCRKAKKWLQEHGIPYTERNIVKDPLTMDEIMHILRLTDNGTEEIISTRSKVFQEMNVDVNQLTLKDLYQIIQDNPTLLRRPIIVDNKRLQVGFNDDEIRKFLPRSVRMNELRKVQKMIN